MDKSTINQYLKKGNLMGLCSYDPEVEREKGKLKSTETNRKLCSKTIMCIETGIVYSSIRECSDKSLEDVGVFLYKAGICNTVNGKAKGCKGYTFKYI